MMRRWILGAVIAGTGALHAQEQVLSTASQAFPGQGTGHSARAMGMGKAYVSIAEGASSLSWNPAGLGLGSWAELLLSHASLMVDMHQENLVLAWQLGKGLGLGLGLNWTGYGNFTERDDQGNPLGSSAASEMELRVGLALPLAGGWTLGVGARALRQNLADEGTENYAGTLGLRWGFADDWSAALVLSDLGASSRGTLQDWTLRTGLSRRFQASGDKAWLAALGYSRSAWALAKLQAGLEVDFNALFALRAGYEWNLSGLQPGGWAGLGVGFGVRNQTLSLDYAWLPQAGLGDAHRVDLGYQFDPVPVQRTVAALPGALARKTTGLFLGEPSSGGELQGAAFVGAGLGGMRAIGYNAAAAQNELQANGYSGTVSGLEGLSGAFWGGYHFPFGLVLELGTQIDPTRRLSYALQSGPFKFDYEATYNHVFIYSMVGYRKFVGRQSLWSFGMKEGVRLLSGSYRIRQDFLGPVQELSGSHSYTGYAFGPVLRWDRLLGRQLSLGIELGCNFDFNAASFNGPALGQEVMNFSGAYLHMTLVGWFSAPVHFSSPVEAPSLAMPVNNGDVLEPEASRPANGN